MASSGETPIPTVRRAHAFLLLVRTYGLARRAALYLLGEDDADAVAPSIYKARAAPKPATPEPVPPATLVAPTAPGHA